MAEQTQPTIEQLQQEIERLKHRNEKAYKAYKRRKQEQALKPYQSELLGLQKYLEESNRRMVILFEGRDASGKGGTIRRVSRYMNEKHYRVVALGKPNEDQKTQWFFQNMWLNYQEAEKLFCLTVVGITGPWWNLFLDFVRRMNTRIS